MTENTGEQAESGDTFDFNAHRLVAEDAYQKKHALYVEFTETVRTLLARALEAERITPHSVEGRAKAVDSFGRKAITPKDEAPSEQPKYETPLEQITDLAGCRVITFFLQTVGQVGAVIEEQFEVLERANRSAFLRGGGERLGYESVHYVVRLHPDRLKWPEYAKYKGLRAEIQVRTILQHAWAEIEHDMQYKAVEALPVTIRRRFLALAGMIEIGDREFQAIADAHDVLRIEARRLINEGKLGDVELTPESLKDYLDKKYGSDGRMTDFSYSYTVRNLKRMGFENLAQLDACISPYDADAVSRTLYGNRQGQLSRLEEVLLASMGENYAWRHPWGAGAADDPNHWFRESVVRRQDALRRAGIPVGSYAPDA